MHVARIVAMALLTAASACFGATPEGGEFSGVWSRSTALCERDHVCTPAELDDADSDPEVCSESMTIVQAGARLCGEWDSGCSFSQASSGVLTGRVDGDRAEVRVGESTAFEPKTFPHQSFSVERYALSNGKLRRTSATPGAKAADADVFDHSDHSAPKLEDSQFLAACGSGVEFDPAPDAQRSTGGIERKPGR